MDDTTTAERQWTSRPRLALAIRAVAFLVPIAASVAVSRVIAAFWPRPQDSTSSIVGWWIILLCVASVVLLVVDRGSRRLLPLSTLLRLSLVFPNKAPSRFGIALRTGTAVQVRRTLEDVRENGLGNDAAVAAERLVELSAAIRAHHRFTYGHGERVRAYSALIGEELGLSPEDLGKLQWAGLIHDVGKLNVPEHVLSKKGALDDDEWLQIRRHPEEGARLIAPLADFLGPWGLAVLEHHERIDGKGYPNQLAGHDISLGGRIVAVADVYDVITAARSYKRPLSPEFARKELADHAGTQFDPVVVRAFLNISIGRLRRAMWPLSWAAHLPFLGPAIVTPVASAVGAVALTAGAILASSPLIPQLSPLGSAKTEFAVIDDQPLNADRILVEDSVELRPDQPEGSSANTLDLDGDGDVDDDDSRLASANVDRGLIDPDTPTTTSTRPGDPGTESGESGDGSGGGQSGSATTTTLAPGSPVPTTTTSRTQSPSPSSTTTSVQPATTTTKPPTTAPPTTAAPATTTAPPTTTAAPPPSTTASPAPTTTAAPSPPSTTTPPPTTTRPSLCILVICIGF